MKNNKMKALLIAGDPAFGCSIMIPSPQVVEMVAHAGFDWVLIDMEHGTIGIESAELMIMAAEASGITPIVRPKNNSRVEISSVMDRGALGVQVPHVNNAEDARNAVAAVRFSPGDNRGMAAGTRPDDYGFSGSASDFVQSSNEQSLVCIQLEHAEAIENVEEILAVDGVDVFFIGPSDLSQSMGHPGNPNAAPVKQAIDETLAAIRAAGKVAGMPSSAENLASVLSTGVQYTYTHLPKLVGLGTRHYRESRRD